MVKHMRTLAGEMVENWILDKFNRFQANIYTEPSTVDHNDGIKIYNIIMKDDLF